MSQLLNEVENFVLRMAAEFPQRKEQLIFLINNYDMMLAVIVVRYVLAVLLNGTLPLVRCPLQMTLNNVC